MANPSFFFHAALNSATCLLLLLLANSATFTSAGRTLLDVEDDVIVPPVAAPAVTSTAPTADVVAPAAAPITPSTTTPATAKEVVPPAAAPITTTGDVVPHVAPPIATTGATTAPIPAPIATAGATTTPITPPITPTGATTTPITPPITTTGTTTTTTAAPPTTVEAAPVGEAAHHPLTFFMHDILGGSNPSARVITGVVSNPAVTGQLPFARPNGAVLPGSGGAGIPNGNNNGVLNTINNNNIPFLTGLGGQTASPIVTNPGGGNNIIGGVNGLPFFNSGQLPAGSTLQKLLFGTMTVIDDVLTEGHELGSGMVGKAQGFYVASSEDGLSQTMAFTAMFGSNHYEDSLCLFGVHKSREVEESQLAVIGGTGKYVKARGFASVKTLHPSVGAAGTDGAETLLEINVYLA